MQIIDGLMKTEVVLKYRQPDKIFKTSVRLMKTEVVLKSYAESLGATVEKV